MAEDTGISWHVTTHEHKERSTDWYWAVGCIAIVGAIVSVFLGNLLLAVIIIIGLGSIVVLAARGPREHMVKIDSRGITLDGTLYRYASIRSFWVEERVEYPRLLVSTSGIVSPQMVIHLVDARQGENVRRYLQKHIKEEEQEVHWGEHLAEIAGL